MYHFVFVYQHLVQMVKGVGSGKVVGEERGVGEGKQWWGGGESGHGEGSRSNGREGSGGVKGWIEGGGPGSRPGESVLGREE